VCLEGIYIYIVERLAETATNSFVPLQCLCTRIMFELEMYVTIKYNIYRRPEQ
jgi:hypothetical protein